MGTLLRKAGVKVNREDKVNSNAGWVENVVCFFLFIFLPMTKPKRN